MRLVPLVLQTTRIYRSAVGGATFSTTSALSAASPEKPSYPVDYHVPDVWAYNEKLMKPIHGSNTPVSGPQREKELPTGDHDIQLYGLATPNGVKASILLEEISDLKDVEYDAWYIDFKEGDQFTSGFVKVNPNSKIPAIFDKSNGARVFESGAILVYLAEKYDAFIPKDIIGRAECLSWVFYQTGASATYGGGGLGHFKNGGAPMNWEYAIDRFTIESKRIMDVMDKHLEGKKYFCGDEISIADFMHWAYTKRLIEQDYLGGSSYLNLKKWVDLVGARPALQRGVRVLGFGPNALKERHSKDDFQ